MEVKEIFAKIEETRIFKYLSNLNKCSFVGEQNFINCLKTRIESEIGANNSREQKFLYWSNLEDNLDLIREEEDIGQRVIIVASFKNEHLIHKTIKKYILEEDLKIQILGLFSDVFINIMSSQDILKSCDYEPKNTHRSYAIVTTPRSGSSFLCSLLRSTNVAGKPKEYFREPSLVLHKRCKFSYLKYLHFLIENKVTSNKVFGTKIMARFLREFEKQQKDFQKFITTDFSKIIYLNRVDKLAQAVSIFLAQKTDYWHLGKTKNKKEYHDFLSTIKIQDADLREINVIYKQLQEDNKYLYRLFDTYQIDPLKIDYEKLELQSEKYIKNILNFIEVEASDNIIVSSSLKKLSSDLSLNLIYKYEQKYKSELDSKYIKELNLLAEIYEKENQLDKAVYYCQRLLKIKPQNRVALIKLAKVKHKQNKFAESVSLYQIVQSIGTQQPASFYIGFGDSLMKNSQIEKAIEAYTQAVENKPDNGIAHAKLGNSMMLQGNVEQSIKHYEKAFFLRPQQPRWVYVSFATALIKIRKISEAISLCQKAIDIYPKDFKILRLLGQAQTELGDVSKAIDYYQRAIEISKNQPSWLYENLNNLLVNTSCEN